VSQGRYRAYPDYKDSGILRLGSLPAHWTVKRLKHSLRLLTDKTEKRDNPVALENIESWSGRFIATESEFQGEGIAFKKGDILFGKLRPYLAKVYRAESNGEAVGDFHVLRPAAEIDGRYAQYIILNREFITEVDGSTYGSKMPRASWEFVGGIEVTTPPLPEQTQIAKFLDHETAKIDRLIEKQEALIRLLKEKRQAVISHAVTKGLNPTARLKDSGIEWLGQVPAHWAVSKIKHVAEVESGHTPDKKVEAYWVNCTIPWVSLNDSTQLKKVDYISHTAFYLNEKGIANSSARKLPAGAVIFTRDASIGLSAITTKEMAVSQHIIAWICDPQKVVPEYLLLVFYAMAEELERYTFGATIKTIGMSDVNTLVGTFPALDEQKHIIDHVFAMKTKLSAALTRAEKLIGTLQERRTALISAAVTGKIDVRHWQPPVVSERTTPAHTTA